MERIDTIGHHLGGYAIEPLAYGYGFELAAQLIGELASLGKEFEAYLGHTALLL